MPRNIHDDFTVRVRVDSARVPWQPSPQSGVERIYLDRVGTEVARATTLVRFSAGQFFPHHTHGGGEEILVLSGVFSDETGHYGAGSYVRNPPGSAHRPYSEKGCVILVKLWQFAPDDGQWVRVLPECLMEGSGVSASELLHQTETERVCLVTYQAVDAQRTPPCDYPAGMELLVLEGVVSDGVERFEVGTWVRWPCGSRVTLSSLTPHARIYQKLGHLTQKTCWDARGAD